MSLENSLKNIDDALDQKEPKETMYLYVMVAGAIMFLSYNFLFEISEKALKKTELSKNKIEKNIRNDKNFLKINSENSIANILKSTEKKRSEHKKIKELGAHIENELSAFSALHYNKKAWGLFLDSISSIASEYKLKINSIGSEFTDKDAKFGHVLNIEISTEGKFQNTMQFINKLEQSELVVDIHKLSLQVDKKLLANITLSVWGLDY